MTARCTAILFASSLWFALAAPRAQQPADAEAASGRGIEIRLQAVDVAGRPVDGARLAIGPRDTITASLADALHATDEQGRAQIEWLPAPIAAADTAAEQPSDERADALGMLSAGVRREGAPQMGRDGEDVLLLFAKGYVSLVHALPHSDPGGPVLDLGTVVLHRSGAIFGRVRTADGEPLGGATVKALDSFRERGDYRARATAWVPVCTAQSDAGGIFHLPGSFGQAVDVHVRKPGYRSERLLAVSQATPLEIVLGPTVEVRGRLLDPTGRGIAGDVVVTFEGSTELQLATSGEDGFFSVPLAHAGRFSLQGRVEGYEPAWQGPLTADGVPIDLTLGDAALPAAANDPGSVTIRAVDGAGAAIPGARAAIIWSLMPATAPYYREFRIHLGMQQATAADELGVVRIPAPNSNAKTAGYAAVVAEGYALATQPCDWSEATETGEGDETLELALLQPLEPEAVIAGAVVDRASGKPLEDAEIWAVPTFAEASNYFRDPSQSLYRAQCDDAGRFAVHHLPAGRYSLRCRVRGRPEVDPIEVDVGTGETRDLRVEVAAGSVLRGTLTGCDVAPGWLARVQPIPQLVDGSWNLRNMSYELAAVPADAVPIDATGHFEIRGLARGHYTLEVLVPGTTRNGAMLRIAVDSFRLRGDLARTIDVSLDRPARVRGRIAFPGTAVPTQRLVILQSTLPPGTAVANLGTKDLSGSWTPVAGDGTFDVAVTPGQHVFRVVDVPSGLTLHLAGPVEVAAGASVDLDLPVPAVEVHVQLAGPDDGEPRADVSRIELRTLSDEQRERQGGSTTDLLLRSEYDMGIGIPLASGQRSATLYVPPGQLALLARSNVDRMLCPPDARVSKLPPLATAERQCELGAGPLELELDPGTPKTSLDQ